MWYCWHTRGKAVVRGRFLLNAGWSVLSSFGLTCWLGDAVLGSSCSCFESRLAFRSSSAGSDAGASTWDLPRG